MRLTPPIQMTLEKALAYIADDELVDPNDRKRAVRAKATEGAAREGLVTLYAK